MATGSHAETQLENDLFRVTKWTIDPGGAIPLHRHEYEYVVVPLVTGTMHVVTADGDEIIAELVVGQSYSRPAGSEHTVENRGDRDPIIFVEVERLSELSTQRSGDAWALAINPVWPELGGNWHPPIGRHKNMGFP
ncbi:hypothetical protein BTO20_07895 [Mycobacterium dioxanotrophicus]|jgi:quercetin dioxygenase-like cupin family protein|uniref:Cupin type-2 domain-containing protein n=1 Tax=Mycobacterium dioxanotrophicus TaxID=482462 RepID=A0A1Y0CDY3_9MYCO|nr:cupin domain-containing protein [Mycobacterium dioxanotrophicus]ART73489.1 hypothetical protein BTO20_07895 [Mycobacterium dioxanotrophicus]